MSFCVRVLLVSVSVVICLTFVMAYQAKLRMENGKHKREVGSIMCCAMKHCRKNVYRESRNMRKQQDATPAGLEIGTLQTQRSTTRGSAQTGAARHTHQFPCSMLRTPAASARLIAGGV